MYVLINVVTGRQILKKMRSIKTLYEQHQFYMKLALKQARLAFDAGEVPVGCILVKDDKIVATAHNQVETLSNPTLHAEMLAIEKATVCLGNKYLSDAVLYVTLEPCPMCASALIWSKLSRVVFGAIDEKRGAFGSRFSFQNNPVFNHSIDVIGGIMEQESESLLNEFFRSKR